MKSIKSITVLMATGILVAGCATGGGNAMSAKDAAMKKAIAADKKPFAGPASVAYADKLWVALKNANLAGPGMTKTEAYKGSHPHGAVLMNATSTLTVDGQTDTVIVKSNFGGEGVSVEAVDADPAKYLKAVTVMYKRPGYDPENKDWFWAKYLSDGTLDKNPKGMQLAGRVAKGKPMGCIACHTAAPGGDMVFTN